MQVEEDNDQTEEAREQTPFSVERQIVSSTTGPDSDRDPDTTSVIDALENPSYVWRSINGIACETGLDPERVQTVIDSAAIQTVLARRSTRDDQDRALFTTRDHYRRKAGFANRLLSAIAGMYK